MVDQSRQSGFRMAKELVGGINPCSTSSFAQRIIFPLQFDRAANEKKTLRGDLTFSGCLIHRDENLAAFLCSQKAGRRSQWASKPWEPHDHVEQAMTHTAVCA
jgi:hypothetical protein